MGRFFERFRKACGGSNLSTDLLLWGNYIKNAFRRFESVEGPEMMRKARKCIYKISKNFRVERESEVAATPQ